MAKGEGVFGESFFFLSFLGLLYRGIKRFLMTVFRRTDPIAQQQLWRARGPALLFGMGGIVCKLLQATTTSLNIHGLYLGELRIAKVDSI